MLDKLDRALSLGFGLAVASKEQVEKMVDDWVKKGEVGKAESAEYVDRLVQKGEEARQQVESTVRERVQSILSEREGKYAGKEEIERLERRLEALEQREFPQS
ncbi:phasin family protein [Paenibacillus sp. NPDC058071]|uniref:phasin family protein n=1 Tax=Paenibacillus sp. NPDC058071 TaxID=3346326 RepID=UPI0036DAA33A